jgi:hypothetical protein
MEHSFLLLERYERGATFNVRVDDILPSGHLKALFTLRSVYASLALDAVRVSSSLGANRIMERGMNKKQRN